MDSNQIAAGVAAVLPLVQFLKFAGLPKQWAPAAVGALALVVTALLIYQAGGVVQSQALSYLTGWIAILLAASGAYGYASVAYPDQTPVAHVAQPKPKGKAP